MAAIKSLEWTSDNKPIDGTVHPGTLYMRRQHIGEYLLDFAESLQLSLVFKNMK